MTTTRTRTVAATLGLAVVATLGLGTASHDTANAQTERGCVLPVEIYEDGSWAGVLPRLDGQTLTHRWVVSGPELQDRATYGDPDRPWIPANESVIHVPFPPVWHGHKCRVVVSH
jgi:hypothetical protein